MDELGIDIKKAASFFRALGNPTRMKILSELTKSDKCVGEVEHCVRASQASVSQHLAILKEYGIVDCCKQGNMRCYSLRQPELIQAILTVARKYENTGDHDVFATGILFNKKKKKRE